MMPNSTVPFVDERGWATPVYQQAFAFPATALVERDGTATRHLTRFVTEHGGRMPNSTVPLVDAERRPVPVFHAVLRGLA